jgi:hypothetical protein
MRRVRLFATLPLLLFPVTLAAQLPPIDFATQGFSMRLRFNNVGAFGRIACPPFNPGNPGTCSNDSIGLEYPLGSTDEHLFAAGTWIGGLLDTATTGISSPLRLASVTYEGWTGPYYEFYPGWSPADTIWRLDHGMPKPPGWDDYWGSDLPYRPFADDNRFLRYTDISVHVALHVPLHLKVVHSSYTWNDPYADGIHVVEYRIFNTGNKIVDSAYVGMFLESDMTSSPYYPSLCYGFIQSDRLAYCQRLRDSLLTPFGIAFIHHPLPVDSSRQTFDWFFGPQSPGDDATKYDLLSSGIIKPGDCTSGENARILLAVGPFTIHPASEPGTEPLRIAVAFMSAPTVDGLVVRAQRARELYVQGTGVRQPDGGVPSASMLFQNYPNPFNPTTEIGFQITDSRWVTLKVYDVLGREVATLVNEVKEPGTYTVQWEASGVASGVYMYQLQTGAFVAARKLLLLR